MMSEQTLVQLFRELRDTEKMMEAVSEDLKDVRRRIAAKIALDRYGICVGSVVRVSYCGKEKRRVDVFHPYIGKLLAVENIWIGAYDGKPLPSNATIVIMCRYVRKDMVVGGWTYNIPLTKSVEVEVVDNLKVNGNHIVRIENE